jgi:hypothetical protein
MTMLIAVATATTALGVAGLGCGSRTILLALGITRWTSGVPAGVITTRFLVRMLVMVVSTSLSLLSLHICGCASGRHRGSRCLDYKDLLENVSDADTRMPKSLCWVLLDRYAVG